MFLHIGTNVLIRTTEMIAIIDRKGLKEMNKTNKKFMETVIKEGEVIDISDSVSENAKTLVLVNGNKIYISPISSQTLYKRSKKFGLSEGLK